MLVINDILFANCWSLFKLCGVSAGIQLGL